MSPVPDVIAAAASGALFIVVDDAQGHLGSLAFLAETVTPDKINFMAIHGRGLIRLALTSERVRQLGLFPMPTREVLAAPTPFTVSIEARSGVTTGISAADRARTIAVAVDPAMDRHEIVSPGHMFPVVTDDGGVLAKPALAEAAVDIARFAGRNPSAVLCQILNDEGYTANPRELAQFAAEHALTITTVGPIAAFARRLRARTDMRTSAAA